MSGEGIMVSDMTANGRMIATWAMVVGAGPAMGAGDAAAATMSFEGSRSA